MVSDLKRFGEFSHADMQSEGEVNLWAPWLLTQQATDSMAERGGGYVLNLSSMGAELPPGPPYTAKTKWHSSLYAAMKSALNTMTVYAAVEFQDKGVVDEHACTAAVDLHGARSAAVRAW